MTKCDGCECDIDDLHGEYYTAIVQEDMADEPDRYFVETYCYLCFRTIYETVGTA